MTLVTVTLPARPPINDEAPDCPNCGGWLISANVEVYELVGEIICNDCAGDFIAEWITPSPADQAHKIQSRGFKRREIA